MTAPANPNQLSADERRFLEAWLATFNQTWDESQLGKQVATLPPPGSALRQVALLELVKIDLRRRWQQGRRVKVEQYLKAFPELGTVQTVPSDLIRIEYEARRAVGHPVDPTSLRRRFPHQADEVFRGVDGSGQGRAPVLRKPLAAGLTPGSSQLVWRWITAGVVAAVLLGATGTALVLMLNQPPNADQPAKTAEPPKTPAPDTVVERPIDKVPKATAVPPPKDVDYVNPNPKPIPSKGVVLRLDQESEVDALGNAQTKATIKMAPAQHAFIRRQLTRQALVSGFRDIPLRMKNFLDLMDMDATGTIVEDPRGEFGNGDIRIRFREIGFARLRGGRWTYALSSDPTHLYELIEKKDSRFVTVRSIKEIGASPVVEQVVIILPAGAHDIQVTRQRGKPSQLSYQLAAPATRSQKGANRPSFALETKPHILSALYKLYGDPRFPKMWAARAAFHNTTGETLTNYRVHFRIVGYSEWSGWKRSEVVYPGQTAVDYLRPIIDAKVRELQGATPVDIEAEYEYVRPNQEKVRDTHTQRTQMSGFNEGVYTDVNIEGDSPWILQLKGASLLLASYSGGNDPVIQDVVGKLSKTIGGVSPTGSDRAAGLFLKALYNLMRSNIAYESARGSVIDGLLHQNLKFARDVLRTKSGTCINTSIFYASVVEAAGLDASIVLIPGHAFAAVRLPKSRQFVFVETTGCGGGTMTTSYPFDLVCKAGAKEFRNALQSGLILQVDIAYLRTKGVAPPELPDAGKNALDQWKITFPGIAPANERPNDTAAVPLPKKDSSAVVVSVRKEPEVVKGGRKGIAFHVRLRINNARGVPCEVLVGCVDKNKRLVKTSLAAYSKGGYLYSSVIVAPAENEAEWADLVLFLPYDGFAVGPGTHRFVAVIAIAAGDKILSKPTVRSVIPLTIIKGPALGRIGRMRD